MIWLLFNLEHGMKKFICVFLILTFTAVQAQIERVEPPNWWIGFANKQVQLLVKAPNIVERTAEINYPGVELIKVSKGSSPNYLFLDLSISDQSEPGKVRISFKKSDSDTWYYNYPLDKRTKKGEDFIGFDSSDAIYLITPDRFSNGNIDNDIIKGLKEQRIDRTDDYARHGGDIEGIRQHLDYISDMGFTAIWPTPLLTNDMSSTSYHGYAITDFYEIDPRFGNLDDYASLIKQARKKGIKIIMDQVANHCGLEHWWMQDLPFKDWVNNQAEFEAGNNTIYSNHRRTTNQDLYASKLDAKGMSNGWFVDAMPDLNQTNPYMSAYLIQNSIWWIENFDLGGIRQDTYPYPDKEFMSNWAGAIMKEYPNFSIVGEEWSLNPLLVGYWQQGANNRDGYKSNLRATMDFPMQHNIVAALKEEESWDKGLVKIYEGLANDFHYANPKDILIFPDNHDMDRIHTQLKEDAVLTKMALAYLSTLPRILQIYYGTEILMQNSAKPGDHGLIRSDFPGGWPRDHSNAFTGKNLTIDQKEMQVFMKDLLQYRKSSGAINNGKTVHFAPQNGIYALFRIDQDEIVTLILNKNESPVEIDLNRFDEIGLKNKKVKNIFTKEEFNWKSQLTIQNKGVLMFTTKF